MTKSSTGKVAFPRIAFQGELGAHSHAACGALYPDMEVLPCVRFDDVFTALKETRAALALIPIENTTAGRVADIHRLLPGAGLYFIGEYFMPIHHQLLGVEGADIGALTHIHSHEMALGQCRGIIDALGLTPVITTDTAGAARLLAENGTPTHAVIASTLAAEIYGLHILRGNIEDSHTNTTRFLVLSPTRQDAAYDGAPVITSFIFRVKNQPAALYKVLGGFATNGVNMTKLESYQPGGFLATQFYADIEGHPDDVATGRALAELDFHCDHLEVLGTYKAAPERAQWAKQQQ